MTRFLAALLAAANLASAAEPIPIPPGWRHEKFEFPLAFAPQIGLEGTEHVRFAPGWGDFAGPRGFSYVFLWDVKEVAGPALTVHGLEFALGVYFDGLMETAAAARKLDARGTRTVVKYHPMRDVPEWTEAHAGSIYTWNAFSKGEALTLEVEVTKRSCPGGRAQVFYAISKAKRSDPAWEALRQVRQSTSCSAT